MRTKKTDFFVACWFPLQKSDVFQKLLFKHTVLWYKTVNSLPFLLQLSCCHHIVLTARLCEKKRLGGRSYSVCNFLYIFITDHHIFSLEYVLLKPDLFISNKPLKIAYKIHKNVLIFLDHNVYNPLKSSLLKKTVRTMAGTGKNAI